MGWPFAAISAKAGPIEGKGPAFGVLGRGAAADIGRIRQFRPR